MSIIVGDIGATADIVGGDVAGFIDVSDVKVMALLFLEKLCNVPYHRQQVSQW